MRKLVYFIFFLTLISCHKNTPDIIKPPLIEKPEILVSQRISGCKGQNNSNYFLEADTTVADSVFTIYKMSNSSLYDPITLMFDSRIKNGQFESIKWKIGEDPVLRTARGFDLTFNNPTGMIKISAIVTWVPNKRAVAQTDTIEKQITISPISSVLGHFQGSNSDAPTDTFTVFIGELNGNVIPSTDRFWGIKNLFKDFPYNLPIYISSNGFGICAAPFPYQQRYNIAGNYYSQAYGVATLTQKKDSITINYSYVQYKDANTYDNIKTIFKTFRGKRN